MYNGAYEEVTLANQFQDKPLFEKTIGQVLREKTALHPGSECVVSPEYDIRWTWREFDRLTDEVGRGLMALGVEKGKHVSIWATNVPEWMLVYFAAAKIGSPLVTVNTNYKQFELEYLLRQSDTHTLIMIDGVKDNSYTSSLQAICPELADSARGEADFKKLPCLKNVIFIGKKENTPEGFLHFDSLFDIAERTTREEFDARAGSVSPHDVVSLIYTSGTTGFPKGVMLTHYNLTNNGQGMGDRMRFTNSDRLLIVVPLFHCFGCVLGVMSCLTHGTTMVLMERFHPVREMEMLEREKCTAVHGVPTMFIAMLEHPEFARFDFSSLRTGIMAGSPCPVKSMKEANELMHLSEITIVFGQTETSPGMTQTRADDSEELRTTTVGFPLPHCEVRIVDPETNEELPDDTQGEIVGRGYNLMKGYYKMPEATAAVVDSQGWLHTGDIGLRMPNGYFKITGRLKDMIIRGGENIYPREIEEFMYTHPAVRDVQVVGVPDEKYGEEVLAWVALRGGTNATQGELIEFVKNGMSRYKSPRYVLFIDEMPMNAAGKVLKYKLREMGIQQLHLEKAASVETA
ncbi:MAG: AMP-binding protein [Oscillospiraceae bacterium]|jgi:fatty-acyl-CoA synthase|nr:AMP-binding protein [Oscillospiraceae bacterium]